MKIAVIAANGRTGQVFVETALNSGHEVIAGVHGENKFVPNEKLRVVTCDATNDEDVKKLISDADAVVSLIGHTKGSLPTVQTDAIRTVITAMKERGIRRIISLTGTGVRFPEDKVTFMDRMLNLSIRVIDPARVKDGIAHAEVLKSSGLDWTIIRVLKLQNVPAKSYQLLANGPTKLYVGRQEVALAILEVLEHNTFITKAPIIAKR
jgi:putative NADH-flavin reductase